MRREKLIFAGAKIVTFMESSDRRRFTLTLVQACGRRRFSRLLSSPRGEKDITQVSGTCSPRSIRGGGILLDEARLDLAVFFGYSPLLCCGGVCLFRPPLDKEVAMEFPK